MPDRPNVVYLLADPEQPPDWSLLAPAVRVDR
jgi:hypothetical protein